MRFEMSPHLFWSNTLVQENQSIWQARSTQPCCLSYPFLNNLQITLENFGSKAAREHFSEFGIIFTISFVQRRWVSVSNQLVSIPLNVATCTYRTKRRFKLKYDHFFAFHQWFCSRSPTSSGKAVAGASFATVWRNSVHHPTTTCWSLRDTAKSNYKRN